MKVVREGDPVVPAPVLVEDERPHALHAVRYPQRILRELETILGPRLYRGFVIPRGRGRGGQQEGGEQGTDEQRAVKTAGVLEFSGAGMARALGMLDRLCGIE
jgi:hypothetical protein